MRPGACLRRPRALNIQMAPAAFLRRAVLVACAIGVALVSAAPSARAGDARLGDLLERYRSTLGRHDDVAYASERETLDAVADLDVPEARRAIRGLAVTERDAPAGGDVRRMALLLSALVRRGGASEFEFAIATVEGWRGAGLSRALPRILGAAVAGTSRAHLREVVLRRGTVAVRAAAARALGAIGDREAVLPLVATLREDDLVLRTETLAALGELRDEGAVPAIGVFLSSADPRVREVAARSLGVLGSDRALPNLVRALEDAAPRVVESAAGALGLLAPRGVAVSVPAIVERWLAVRGKDGRVEEAFERALARITGVDVGDDPELWKSWWAANKDRSAAELKNREAPTTVAGARYYGFGVRSDHVVFVVDVSRSMGWNGRLDAARRELVQVLGHLPARTRFTIIPFADAAWPWSDKLVPALPDAIKRAVRFVERLEPVSGTNSFEALRAALADEEVDSVYFLSDGHPSVGAIVDPDEILTQIHELNRWRRVRIHTIAMLMGDPPAAFAALEDATAAERFMRRLADENDGRYVELR